MAARVVDQDYQGQYFGVLINTSDQDTKIYENQKFVQVVLVPINQDKSLQEISIQNLYGGFKTPRGTGAFGSTNKK